MAKKKVDDTQINNDLGIQPDCCSSKSDCCSSKSDNTGIIIFFMVIMLIISIISTYILINGGKILGKKIFGVRDIVKQELNVHEYDKVGGKANYDVVSQAQIIQLNQQIDQIKSYVEQNKDKLENIGTQSGSNNKEQAATQNNTPEQKNKLEVFLMGYCPYGEIAAKQIPALFKQFTKDNLNFDIHYIANKTGEGYEAKDFNSLHGVTEAEEDIRQLCIKKEYGISRLVDYQMVRYANADNHGAVTEGPEKAIESIKGDVNKIATCVTSGEGGKLLEEDIKIANSLGVQGSPTWLANNKFQFGGIEGRKIATEFCKYNGDLTSCKEGIKIEDNSTNPNSTPACGN